LAPNEGEQFSNSPSAVSHRQTAFGTIRYFGDYELLEEIARGGMGVVYKARQLSLNRLVAVKMILSGQLASRSEVQRFRTEAEAAAQLDHPNIVPIYEVGEHQGQHYFSMKLVDGPNLAQKLPRASGSRLPIRDSALLLAKVARAVHYAHQRGILHRDIKPTNILVDQRGEPQLTDFGLARLVEKESSLTQSAAVLGSANYMAPEQASGQVRQLTTATDVYGLGAVLYHMLTGCPPFAAETFVETIRQVVEHEPVPPSQVLRRLASELEITNGKSEIDKDLETISLRCLEKDPVRRYGSADALARDLERWSRHEPIEARPATPIERVIKWSRRKPSLAAAVAAFLLALVLGMAGVLWQWWRAERLADQERSLRGRAERAETVAKTQLAEALKQKKRADEEAATADAVNEFLQQDLLMQARADTQASEGITIDPNLTVRAAVDRAAERIGNRFTNMPLVEASIRMTLAHTYDSLGEWSGMRSEAQRALQLRKDILGAEHASTLDSMNCLAIALRGVGLFTEATTLDEQVLESRKRLLGPDHPSTLTTMNNLAVDYKAVGKLDLVLPLLDETLRWKKARLGPEHRDTIGTMGNLALAYRAVGKPDQALPLLEETFRQQKATLGPDHPHTLGTMANLAVAYEEVGKLDQALLLYEQTLKLQEATLGPEHPDTVHSMNNLAAAYKDAGRLDLAVPLAEQALKLRKAKLGPEHPSTLASMQNLAGVYKTTGRLDLAMPLLEQVLKMRQAKLGADHPDTLAAMDSLASAYGHAGKLDLAVPLFEQVIKMYQAKLGPDHPDTLNSMNNLAAVYKRAKQFDLALPLFEQTLKLRKAKLGPEHPDTFVSMNNLAAAHDAAGHLDQALSLYEETLNLQEAKLGPEHPGTLNTMNNLAGAYRAIGKLNQALPLLEELLKRRKARLGPEHHDTLSSMDILASAYKKSGKFDQALPLYEESLRLREAKLGPEHPSTLHSIYNLAAAYQAVGKFDRAVPLFERELAHRKAKLGREHPDTIQTLNDLARTYEAAGKPEGAEPLFRELLGIQERKFGSQSAQYAVAIARLGVNLLFQKKYDQAESLLRAELDAADKNQPNNWTTFNTRSTLGSALLGQHKLAEAETLLLSGYQGMKVREAHIPASFKGRLKQAVTRLVELYNAKGDTTHAVEWQKQLTELDSAQAKPQPSTGNQLKP
jgi:serine/threonine protein kinase/uncharacterized protein YjgD (DUF1641 family)